MLLVQNLVSLYFDENYASYLCSWNEFWLHYFGDCIKCSFQRCGYDLVISHDRLHLMI